jgi:hypothetical protein
MCWPRRIGENGLTHTCMRLGKPMVALRGINARGNSNSKIYLPNYPTDDGRAAWHLIALKYLAGEEQAHAAAWKLAPIRAAPLRSDSFVRTLYFSPPPFHANLWLSPLVPSNL